MGVKNLVSERLEKARSFADSVRTVYESAYSKATEMRKNGVNELVKDIQPRFRAAVEEGIHGAQTVLDEFNQSLADKAIPSFRKGAVSREQLEQKAKGAGAQAKTKSVKASGAKRATKRNNVSKRSQLEKKQD